MPNNSSSSDKRPTPGRSKERLYFDVLRRIAAYQSPEELRSDSEKDWGLPYEEALEMAYENVLDEARSVLKGTR